MSSKISLKKISFILLLGLLLNACATKEYTKQQSVFIVFKTPTFKHADLGFIYENSEEIKVEIYGSGQALMSLSIDNDTVCMSLLACMSHQNFNKDVLSTWYPDGIIGNIFRGKELFFGQNLVKTRNGFTQKIMKQGKYNIDYSVLNKQILFRDTINDILIKVKRLK